MGVEATLVLASGLIQESPLSLKLDTGVDSIVLVFVLWREWEREGVAGSISRC